MSDSEMVLCRGQGTDIENISPFHRLSGGGAQAPHGTGATTCICPSKTTLSPLLANHSDTEHSKHGACISAYSTLAVPLFTPLPHFNVFSPSKGL